MKKGYLVSGYHPVKVPLSVLKIGKSDVIFDVF